MKYPVPPVMGSPMDDPRFDAISKAWARGSSRRTILKGLLGCGRVMRSLSVLATNGDTADNAVSCPYILRGAS